MSTLYYETDYLMHHGIKGQKWGVRRYQNEDGTLTEAGKTRYITSDRYAKNLTKSTTKAANTAAEGGKKHYRAVSKQLNAADQYRAENEFLAEREYKRAVKASKKMAKAESSGKTDKATRYRGEMQAHAIASDHFKKRADIGKGVTELICSLAPALQYDISTKSTQRSVDKGRSLVTALSTAGMVQRVALMPGTKYKVRGK